MKIEKFHSNRWDENSDTCPWPLGIFGRHHSYDLANTYAKTVYIIRNPPVSQMGVSYRRDYLDNV